MANFNSEHSENIIYPESSMEMDKFESMQLVINDLFKMATVMSLCEDANSTSKTIYNYFTHEKIKDEIDVLFLKPSLKRTCVELLKKYADEKLKRKDDAVHVILFLKFAFLVQEFNTDKNIASIVMDKFKKLNIQDCEWLDGIVNELLFGKMIICNC